MLVGRMVVDQRVSLQSLPSKVVYQSASPKSDPEELEFICRSGPDNRPRSTVIQQPFEKTGAARRRPRHFQH
jgi:hypothetical protein